jgi:hypothetical protein
MKYAILIVLALLVFLKGIDAYLKMLGKEKLFVKEQILYGKIIGAYNITTPEIMVETDNSLCFIIPVSDTYVNNILNGKMPNDGKISIRIQSDILTGQKKAFLVQKEKNQ